MSKADSSLTSTQFSPYCSLGNLTLYLSRDKREIPDSELMESPICGYIQYFIYQIMAFKKYMLKEKVGGKNGGRRKIYLPRPLPPSFFLQNKVILKFPEYTGD